MQSKCLDKLTFVVGCKEDIEEIKNITPIKPFSDNVIAFLSDASKWLMNNKDAKKYPDVITLAFWMRKSALIKLRERFSNGNELLRTGRGIAFHIAPSNVPVNFAYSLVTGLLAGNSNIVRIPSKEFEQITIIADCLSQTLKKHEDLRHYIMLVRYDHDKEINDLFSGMADIRIIWGGDDTINEIRRSPIGPRSVELTFADRYSLAVIDSDHYLALDNKDRVAEDFYNDTFLTDQNACTSPRIVVWMGNNTDKARREFWEREHRVVKEKYVFHSIQAVDKLTALYYLGASIPGCIVEDHTDNLIIRVKVEKAVSSLMDYKESSGFFFEYECKDILEIRDLCDDVRCQTIGYIGSKDIFIPLVNSGIKGVDRIVPVGKTMDFDLIWDGYDLITGMTRSISVL